MTNHKTLILYGEPSARELAKTILENEPAVQSITLSQDSKLRLLLDSAITEISLIPLLQQSGISGFRLM